jgi:hypothetical protein
MGNFVFNQGAGKVSEWAARVIANDPTNSVFVINLWNAGATTDATIRDLTDVAAIEADVNVAELTGGTYARKTISDSVGSLTVTIDTTNDRIDVDIADQTWTALTSSGTNPTDLGFNYDSDSTSGTDSAIKPATWHDFVVTLDGSDVTAQVAVFFRAQT